jgi:ketosteroid isomerase-like protein
VRRAPGQRRIFSKVRVAPGCTVALCGLGLGFLGSAGLPLGTSRTTIALAITDVLMPYAAADLAGLDERAMWRPVRARSFPMPSNSGRASQLVTLFLLPVPPEGATVASQSLGIRRNSHEEGVTHMKSVTKPIVTFAAGALAGILSLLPAVANPGAEDVAQIKAQEEQYGAAVNAKDLDAIMKAYVPGETVVVFDALPPRQYVGAVALRKDWADFLAATKGPLKLTITDVACDANGSLGYCRSIQRYAGTDTKDKPFDLTVRQTDVYGKVDGRWVIVHQHISFPVDLGTGKPDFSSKP